MMHFLTRLLAIVCSAALLSGCVAAAVGAGAAGGYYLDKNYTIEKKDDSKSTDTDDKTSQSTTGNTNTANAELPKPAQT